MQILERLSGNHDKLSKSDMKIAAVVLREPQVAIHLSIAKLAAEAEVSEPTVNRLCRKLGCTGYPDFKLKLAQEISRGSHLFSENLEASDDTHSLINKVLSSIEQSVRSIGQATSPSLSLIHI